MNKKDGITLIALIITIIVMIILVSVTISIAVNGGLFNYAGKAAKDTEIAKNKELDWLNIEGNMSTDQLIAKFTTDREKDLDLIRRAVAGEQSALNQLTEDINNEEGYFVDVLCTNQYEIVCYHGYYYKVIGNFSNGFTEADYLNNKEELYARISETINNMEASEYLNGRFTVFNNNLYMLIESEDTIFGEKYEDISMAAVVYDETDLDNFIIIRPTANQTWSNWASTSEDDLIMNNGTLKQMINAPILELWCLIDSTRVINYDEVIITNSLFYVSPNWWK